MAATITKGQTFGATELVTNTKLNNLVDSATIANISNAEIASDASIVGSKLDLSAPGIIGATTPSAITCTTITATSISNPSYNLVMWENDFVSYENDAITII